MLTDTEKRVIGLIAEGMTKHQVAKTLYISEGTVRTHCESIRKKLKSKTMAQAVYEYFGGKQ